MPRAAGRTAAHPRRAGTGRGPPLRHFATPPPRHALHRGLVSAPGGIDHAGTSHPLLGEDSVRPEHDHRRHEPEVGRDGSHGEHPAGSAGRRAPVPAEAQAGGRRSQRPGRQGPGPAGPAGVTRSARPVEAPGAHQRDRGEGRCSRGRRPSGHEDEPGQDHVETHAGPDAAPLGGSPPDRGAVGCRGGTPHPHCLNVPAGVTPPRPPGPSAGSARPPPLPPGPRPCPSGPVPR